VVGSDFGWGLVDVMLRVGTDAFEGVSFNSAA
jgi:hypothetical protein